MAQLEQVDGILEEIEAMARSRKVDGRKPLKKLVEMRDSARLATSTPIRLNLAEYPAG